MEDVTAVPVAVNSPAPEQPAASPAPAPTGQTVAEQLAAARVNAAKRDTARKAERDAAELVKLQLEDRFEKDLNGRRGQAFEIVDVSELGEGHIVVKLGEDVLFNAFKASKMDVVDLDSFVTPCVKYPSIDQYRQIVKRRAFIADRCANALGTLYGIKAEADAGK
jgi:hypothetical protein